MSERDQLTQRLKAEAFDRILEKHATLQDDAGFYSKNWVELSELIEAEAKQIQWVVGKSKGRSYLKKFNHRGHRAHRDFFRAREAEGNLCGLCVLCN